MLISHQQNNHAMNIRCTPAMADALSKILTAECIPHSHGLGPSCIVIIIDRKNDKRMKKALKEWKTAVDMISLEVGLAEITLDY